MEASGRKSKNGGKRVSSKEGKAGGEGRQKVRMQGKNGRERESNKEGNAGGENKCAGG